MTRSRLAATLSRIYILLALVLAASLALRLAEHIPGIAGTKVGQIAKDLYDYMKDMALVFITVVAAVLASVFQRRHAFVDALKHEWGEIVTSKSALFTYTQLAEPTQAQYLATFCRLSETIDNMRTVYRNVGETDRDGATPGLIGLYPYAPLHDMRRALQALDPTKSPDLSEANRRLVRDAIMQSFYALRESFLDELDPEEPDNPLLIYNGRRLKKPGEHPDAAAAQVAQRAAHDAVAPPDPRITPFLVALYDKEQATAKPWREVAGGSGSTRHGGDT